MCVLVKTYNYYKLLSEKEELISSSFCGHMIDNLIPRIECMDNKIVHTLMGFYTIDKYKNKGFGKKLLLDIIQHETDAGVDYLRLGVYKSNEYAIKLYKSCGFIIGCDFGGCHMMYKKLK